MRTMALFLALSLVCLVSAGDKKEPSSSRNPFDRSVKILRFGQLNEFYEPGKLDGVVSLGLLGDERAVPVLAEHLANEKDGNLRFHIVKALGWIKSTKAVPALEKALKDDYIHARHAAVLALKEITGKEYKAEPPSTKGLPDSGNLDSEISFLQGAGLFPKPDKPSLESGKTYRFTLASKPGGDLVAKVLEVPTGNWVKVQVHQSKKLVTSWINLANVDIIMSDPDEK